MINTEYMPRYLEEHAVDVVSEYYTSSREDKGIEFLEMLKLVFLRHLSIEELYFYKNGVECGIKCETKEGRCIVLLYFEI